jgi:tRNA threonylcarbamoyladenosine biosynthesis protein TsaB
VRVLAIDTTTARGSVAVVEGTELRGELRLTTLDSHSTRILGAVDFLLRGLSLSVGELDGFALAIGPGSFTGLRVGIATIQGLSVGAGQPIAGISTLDALAHRIRGTADRLVVLMDAYRDGVNVAVYDREARPVEPPRLERPDDMLLTLPRDAAFIGEAAQRHRAHIEQLYPGAVFPERSLFLAGTLARMAVPLLAAGQGVSADELRPLYLREPHIGSPRT